MEKKLEKLVKEIMRSALADGEPVTEEEAIEMAKMELGAKENVTYNTADKTEKKAEPKKRNVIVSDEKKELFNTILANLDRVIGVERENIAVLKENKLIEVKIGDRKFKIDVIEERKPKKK